VDARRKVGLVWREVGRFRDLRLTGEQAGEAVVPTGELDPFLRDGEVRRRQDQGCRNDWHQAHDLSSIGESLTWESWARLVPPFPAFSPNASQPVRPRARRQAQGVPSAVEGRRRV